MAWSIKNVGWVPGSVVVEGNAESDRPTWVMTARRGQQRIDLASGPLGTRDIAERVAKFLNDQDSERWDYLLVHVVPQLLSGEWG